MSKLWMSGGNGGIAYSVNGITWTVSSSNQTNDSVYNTNLGIWLAGGNGGVSYSTNGLVWTIAPGSNSNITPYGIACNNTKLCIVASIHSLNTLAYSINAITWTGLGSSALSTEGRGIAYSSNQDLWVAGGTGTYTIAYSKNGVTWTGIAGSKTLFTNYAFYFAYNTYQNLWIAAGWVGGVAYSTNGFNWTASPTQYNSYGIGVAYSPIQDMWVSTGTTNDSIGYSKNGLVWTAVPDNTSIFSSYGQRVAYSPSQNIWTACGGGTNTVAYSTNGVTWTGQNLAINTWSSISQGELGWTISGLVTSYNFKSTNVTNGNVLNSSSGLYDLSLNSCTVTTQNGINCIYASTAGYKAISTTLSVFTTSTTFTGVTFSMWVYPTSGGGMFGFGSGPASGTYSHHDLVNFTGGFRWNTGNGTTNYSLLGNFGSNGTSNAWNYVNWSITSSTANLYYMFNITPGTYTGTLNSMTQTGGGAINFNCNTLWLFQDLWSDAGMSGYIADFRIYSYAMTNAQATAVYNAGPAT